MCKERLERYQKLTDGIEEALKRAVRTRIRIPVTFKEEAGTVIMVINQLEPIEPPHPFQYVIDDAELVSRNTGKEGEYEVFLDMTVGGVLLHPLLLTLQISAGGVAIEMYGC